MSEAPDWFTMEVDENVFSIDVITKAVYWLSGKYMIDVRRALDNRTIEVRITGADRKLSNEEQREVEARLRRDLVDFRTRAIVDQETRTLRELLVAKAFAYGDED